MSVIIVKKIPFAKNLVDTFSKTLSSNVFYGHKDSIDIKYIPNMLWGLIRDC